MRFLVDTNIWVHALNGSEIVRQRIMSCRRPDIALSVVTEAELLTGAAKSPQPDAHKARVERMLTPFEILDFTSVETETYAGLRAQLERKGTPIGALDMLIAAHAKALDLTLVTANEREFRRVPGLRVENWSR